MTSISYNEILAHQARMPGLNRNWEQALEYAIQVNYPAKGIIPHKSHKCVYYIKKGAVKLSYYSHTGQERIALYYEEGSLFNEARAFSGYEPDGVFSCISDVELYLFKPELILSEKFIQKYPLLISNIMSTMGAKILLHYTFLAEMGMGSHIAHMCRLIKSMSQKNNGALKFSADMTQQEIATMLGVHRTTLARIVRKLIQLGIIEKFTRKEVIIINMEMLATLACE